MKSKTIGMIAVGVSIGLIVLWLINRKKSIGSPTLALPTGKAPQNNQAPPKVDYSKATPPAGGTGG
jgi:hypothetical protein